MDAERWQQVQELLARALDLPAGERARFVLRAAGDEGLRDEVLSLLDAAAEADDYFGELGEQAGAGLAGLARTEGRLDATDGGAGPEDATGRRVGRWRLDRFLGRGGMGSVYLAHRDDGEFAQRVAIKLLSLGATEPEARRRFLAEREILARLQHPGIAALYDGGVHDDGTPYFVMEFVDGMPIDRHCDENGLDLEQRLRCFLEVCEAVEYAHGQHVIHRDLKPANILVSDGRVRLLDFGIAKSFSPQERFGIQTTTGRSPMTPMYASPEQLGGGKVTTATDVYALGVLLHELLVGLSPYDVNLDSNVELVRAVCERPVAAPSTRLRRMRSTGQPESDELQRIARQRGLQLATLELRLRGDLDTILLEALHKDPRERYASVRELADDVARHLERRPVLARRDGPVYRTRRFLSRHRVPAVAVGLALLLSLALVVTGLRARHVAERQAQELASREQVGRELLDHLTELYQSADPESSGAAARAARGMLHRAVERLDGLDSVDPSTRASLLVAAGRVCRRLGDGERAEPLLSEALAIRRAELDPPCEELAEVLFELGTIRARTADAASGVELLEEGLEMALALHGKEHLHTGQLRYELATAMHNAGDPRSQEEFAEAVRVFRSIPPEETHEFAAALLSLGDWLAVSRDLDGAIELYRAAEATFVRLHGEYHPAVGRARGGVGMLMYTRGEREEGIETMRGALEIVREVFGDQPHPELAALLQNLGAVLVEEGDPQGVDLLQEAVDVFSRLDPPRAGERAFCLTRLGRALAAEDPAAAAEAYEEALEEYRRAEVSELFQVGPKLALAALLTAPEDAARAVELLEEVEATYAGAFPDDHPPLARVRQQLQAARAR